MGKVIVLISTTPDGFAEAQNITIDADFFEFVQSLMAVSELAVFGRKTFEIFQERWPQRLRDENTPDWMRQMAGALHKIPKVVFSSTLKETTWHHSTISDKLDLEYVKSFKKNHKGAMMTVGSLSIIESLTELNAVDDYYFNIQPVIAGKGEDRLFRKMNLKTTSPLKFVDCFQQPSGAHVIHYKNEDAVQ